MIIYIGCLLLAAALLIYYAHKFNVKVVQPGKVEQIERDDVLGEFKWLYERIQSSSTRTELASLEELIDDFEASHKSRMDIDEYYKDLLCELQARYNVLSVKMIRAKIK